MKRPRSAAAFVKGRNQRYEELEFLTCSGGCEPDTIPPPRIPSQSIMAIKPPILLGGAIVLVLSGFLAGRFSANRMASGTAGPPAANSRNPIPASHQINSREARNVNRDPTVDADAEWLSKMSGPARAAALEEKARSILFETDPSQRLLLFSSLLQHMQPGDYETIVKAFAFHDHQGRFFYPEFEFFCAAAGRVDGRATMEIVTGDGNANNTAAQDKVLNAWAVAEPAQAIAWWNALPDGQLRNDMAKSLVKGVASKDFQLGWQCLTSFPEEERPKFMGTLVRQKIAEGGFDAASAWLSGLSLEDGGRVDPLKAKGFESMYNAMPNIGVEKRAEYLARFANEPWIMQTQYSQVIANEWASKDGGQAAQWAANLPSAVQANTLPSVLQIWAGRDEAAAAAWFKENAPAGSEERYRARVGELLGETDPNRATSWLSLTER